MGSKLRIRNYYIYLSLLIISAILITGCATGGAAEPVKGNEPIVIGFVGNTSSPGTRPNMDVQQMAVDEINAAGGILGRPVKYIVEENKGQAALAVAADIRMVLGNKAKLYFTEGYSEIASPQIIKSAEMYPQNPHIVVQNGGVNVEQSERVVSEYDKYKFYFNDYNMAPGHYAWAAKVFDFGRKIVGAKKIALLIEEGGWALPFREGMPKYDLPSWMDMATKEYGYEVVYYKPMKIRTGMYLPILEAVAASGADYIFSVSSWATDNEVFAKQWAESSARDIPVMLYGGLNHTYKFWGMTGGTCLGLLSLFWEYEIPITEKTIPFLKKVKAKGIPAQHSVHFAYDDIYFFKKAVETAGTADDIEAIIKAYEDVSIVGSTGTLKMVKERVAPWCHSIIFADQNNPRKLTPGYQEYLPIAQFQQNGSVVILDAGKFGEPQKYKTPAQLRAEAGIK